MPAILNTKVYDAVIPVGSEEAYRAARLLAKTEGILAGISSGAALSAALALAKRPENAGEMHRGSSARYGRPVSIHGVVCAVSGYWYI